MAGAAAQMTSMTSTRRRGLGQGRSPNRHHFVQIQNRRVVAETEMIKQGNVTSKLFPDEDLVISPHRNDEVGSLDQLLGKLSLNMSR